MWRRIWEVGDHVFRNGRAAREQDWEVEEGEPGIDLRDDDESGIEAIDTVRGLLAAAAVMRVGPYHYQTPKVRVRLGVFNLGSVAMVFSEWGCGMGTGWGCLA